MTGLIRSSCWALAALVLSAGFVRLGLWQLSRADAKRAWADGLAAAARAPQLSNADWRPEVMGAQHLHRRVLLHGQWAAQHSVYLQNRSMGGVSGFVLVTPLVLDAQRLVVVQRGWLPRHRVDPLRLPPVDTPSGSVTVQGVVSDPPSQYFALEAAAQRGLIRSNLDWADYAAQLGGDIGRLSLRQTGTDSEGLRREWDPIDAKIPTHRAYAVQWFSLAALTVGLYVWFQFLAPKRRRA